MIPRTTCRSFAVIAAIIASLALVGCVPEKRVIFSPDGRSAAVAAQDGLYLTDAVGRSRVRIAEDGKPLTWSPDSKRLFASTSRKIASWQDVLPILAPAEQQEIIRRGEATLAEVNAHQGSLDGFQPYALQTASPGVTVGVLLYLREKHAPTLTKRFGPDWDKLVSEPVAVSALREFTIDNGVVRESRVLLENLSTPTAAKLSPDGAFIATALASSELVVCSVRNPSERRLVASSVSADVAWSPDSRSVFYVQYHASEATSKPSSPSLGVMTSATVAERPGHLSEPIEYHNATTVSFVDANTRLASTSDGRILFATVEATMPMRVEDMADTASLWIYSPGTPSTLVRALPRSAERQIGNAATVFELSPDGSRVAVANSEGEVFAVTLATGDVLPVSPPGLPGSGLGKLHMVPTWVGGDRICLVIPAQAAGATRPEIAVAEINWATREVTHKSMSKDWPAAMTDSWLTEGPTTPTTAP